MTSNGKKKKAKKPKQSKSVSKFPQLPAEDFGDGLQGLAEEFRRSKEKEAADYEIKDSQIAQQQEEILKLQQQLSTALQKQLTMSEEHIKGKNEFMNVSRDLERVKAELAESREERQEAMDVLKDRDQIIEEDKSRIENLEQAIDKQLGKEEELMKNVQQSEEEIENLLVEIQKFESKLENGDAGDGGASFVELRNVKKDLTDREEEIASQKFKIEQLEKDLQESITVPQLQIEELDQENKALQGRLKGERLEYTSKLSAKDDVIQNLRTELANYTASPDAQDLQSALQKLAEAREDATTVRESLAAAVTKIETLEGEKEDFMEEFNLLKDNNVFMEKTVKELTEKADGLAKKVLEWTEKTYDWKERAETAERKLEEGNVDKEKAGSETGDSAGPQTMFLQAAMDKGKKGNSNRGSWGILNKFASENQEESAEQVRVRVLEDQNIEYEAKIAQLSSDIVKMQTGHKEELYTTKKKIAQLEGENEALTLQNSTLQELTEE
jgi:chromosome segregation ATPase